MRTFEDRKGRKWSLHLDVAAVQMIRDSSADWDGGTVNFAVNPARAIESIDPVHGGLLRLVGVLWLLCESQAVEREVSEEEFGRGLYGDAIDEAVQALIGELTDFSPRRLRHLLEKAEARRQKLEAAGAKALEARIESGGYDEALMGDQIDEALRTEIRKAMAPPGTEAATETRSPTAELSENRPD